MKNKIMIIGGYDAVGRIISEQLFTLYPNLVIIAGRRLDKAQTLARKLWKYLFLYHALYF